jgi:class 3 adenylate cyclase/nicotinamidase-related amidase
MFASVVLLAVLAVAGFPEASAKPASACVRLGKSDAVIAVCLQNDFLDERPADGSYALGAKASYEIPEEHTHESKILRGALAVGRSEEVVPVANEWMARVDAAGGTVIATLDSHPAEHCSFCRFGKNQEQRLDCIWGCNGTQGICVTGAGVPTAVFDSSSRCVDPVSEMDFQQSRYFQWPTHCVKDTFGSRFDPYLRVPSRAVKVHAGTREKEDSYSAFGARDEETDKPLLDILRETNARRVFVLGLATDYVVKETVHELVDSVTKTSPKNEAVFVSAGSRGVFDKPGEFYGSDPQTSSGRVKAEFLQKGVAVVAARSVDAALNELCFGTCDADADCALEEVCVAGEPYGRCAPRPEKGSIALPIAITLAAMVGAFVVFKREIVDYLSNRRKRGGPPTDYVVLVETDIEGSSELWETMGAAGYGDIMKDQVMGVHDEVLRRSMKKHYGYELFVRGDAFVVAFHAVDDALAWCLQVQLDLMASAWPPEMHDTTAGTLRVWGTYEGLRVRMGVHCGHVESAVKHQGKMVYEGEVMRQVTGVADSGNGGQIILSQDTLPLSADVELPYVMYDQGLHRVKDFANPQRLKEVYPESLASRATANGGAQKLDTEERLSPSFHAAPEGLVTMIYCHAENLAGLKKALPSEVVEQSLRVMAEQLRACMMERGGYDCRGHERNGENMYVFASYVDCALFAVNAQKALHEATWPPELVHHYSNVDDPSEPKRIRGLRVRMGMHSGQLKRIRIPSEGLADYYGESANRAARVMSTSVGGQVVCVASELEYFLDEHRGGTPRLLIDPLGTFTLKGIPGQTALVQLSLDETMASFGNRRFVQSKKAQQVTPGDGFARVVLEAIEATREPENDAGGAGGQGDQGGGASRARATWSKLKAQVKKGAFKQPSNEGLEALSQLTGSRPPSERRLKRSLDGNGNPTRRSLDDDAE